MYSKKEKHQTNNEGFMDNNTLSQGNIDIYSIVSKSNVILLIWFLAIYIIISFVLKTAFSSNDQNYNIGLMTSRTFDFIIIFFIIILCFANPNWVTLEYQIELTENTANIFQSFADEKTSTFSTLFFIFVFYTLIYIFGIPMNSSNKSFFILKIEVMAWFVLLMCILNLFFMSVLGFSLIDLIFEWIHDIWKGIPVKNNKLTNALNAVVTDTTIVNQNVNISGNTVCGNSFCGNGMVCGSGNICVNGNNTTTTTTTVQYVNTLIPEVFNISNNIYTYEEAQAVCSAVGSQLATYEQIEESYNDGGEWCNMGWTDGQMALYPTQKDTWNRLQQRDSTKNSCGRPGINGGYVQNPYMKFGVNCFGIKPPPKESDLISMQNNQNVIYPKTPEEVALETKIQYWKNNANQMLNINPFNNKTWSETVL